MKALGEKIRTGVVDMTVYNQTEQIPLEELVLQIQNGDREKHDFLLKTYQPFMVKVVSQVCKRYIDPLQDDEFSIGLLAFNEAIFLYQPKKGKSFLSFAKTVVTRKVIDYLRHTSRMPDVVSIESYYDEEKMENPLEVSAVIEKYHDEEHELNRRLETLEFRKKLREYNLSIRELVEIAPKHRNSRVMAIRIARLLAEDEVFREYVSTRKRLPLKLLTERVDVSKKTLEKNRKYILALFIVLTSDFEYLQEYLKEAEG